MDINKKMSQFVDIEALDETTLIPVVQGSPLFNAKITPKKFASSIAPYVLEGIDFSAVELRLDVNELAIQNLESNKVDNSRVLTDVPLNAKFTDTIVDISNKVDKVTGKSLVDDLEIQRLANVTNQVVPTKTSEIINDSGFIDADDLADLGGGDMLKYIYDTDNSGVVDNAEKVNGLTVETAVPLDAKFTDTITDVSGLATKLELEDKVDKEYGMTLIDEEEVTRLSTVVNQDISNLATKDELENLVVKEAGKSLILDTEIERLESVTNQTLEDLGAEDVNNKKSIINEESDTEYPTSKAVADYVTDNLNSLELTGYNFTGSEVDLSTPLGAYQVAIANTSTAYTLSANKVIGGWSKIKINASTEPTVTDGIKIKGSDFTASTDMYLLVEYNGTTTEYYFAEI